MAVRQISVKVGTVTERKTVVVMSSTTLRSTFQEAGYEYEGGLIQLDGNHIGIGDLDRTYDDLGIVGTQALLVSIIKGENA